MIMQAWEKRYELTAEATKIEIEQYSKHFDDADVLRVFVADEFVPKRLDFHDETILNKLCNNWRSLNEVMKEILVPQQSTGYHQIEYFYVLWRLSVLSDINVLEYTGDFEGGDTSGCYIRLRN